MVYNNLYNMEKKKRNVYNITQIVTRQNGMKEKTLLCIPIHSENIIC